MKKAVFINALILVGILGVWYVLRREVGDLRPLFPVTENAADKVKQTNQRLRGEPLDVPLKLPAGFRISVFADEMGSGSPRDLQITPGGSLLVSIPNQGQVLALIDSDKDGTSEEKKVVLQGLNRPHGLAFWEDKLYVAEEEEVVRYIWNENEKTAEFDKKLFDLPAGGRHWTRTIEFTPDGSMYVSLGSSCDVCRENHPWLAAVIKSNANGDNPQVFAQGLRNAVFIKVNPSTNKLWGVEMGRDFLGDDKPPDEINIIKEGHYGWPYCYGDKIYDPAMKDGDQSFCDSTASPVYEIEAHSAPLGLVFINSPLFPQNWQGDLLVAYHGSWNRSTPVGYKVVRLDVEGENIVSEEDFLTGFLQGTTALGRPVDLEFGKAGELYLSDDKAKAVYLIISD